MKKIKVVATDGFDVEAQEKLRTNSNIELIVYKSVAAGELLATLTDADIVIIRSATVLNREILTQLPNLKGVLRAGVGVDNIDLVASEELGVWVWNAPSGNYQATAELALGLLFSAARKISWADAEAKKSKWAKKEIGTSGRQLSGSVLGLYGAGNIGSRVAKMANALGMKVQICDPVYQESAEIKKVSFDELLSTSDFITIHAPLLPSTKHAFHYEVFSRMKKSAILVHAARGGIVCDADLNRALKEDLIAGAALDVFEKEPFDSSYDELIKNPRVVATPHIGASTLESQRLVGLEAAEKINKVELAVNAGSKAPKTLNKAMSPKWNLLFDA